MVGDDVITKPFLDFMTSRVQLNHEGPFTVGDEFSFLKKKYEIHQHGILSKPDPTHIKKLKELVLTGKWRERRTPCEKWITDVDVSEELGTEKAFQYRQAVGRLLYLNPERPDVQFTVSCLASKMCCPTISAWKHLQRLVEYLATTEQYGVMLEPTWSKANFLYVRGNTLLFSREVENKLVLELEAYSDADWAGNKEHRRSSSCCQVYLQGCLVYSYSRSQKSVTLSSAEAEYVALVGSSCEAILIRDAVNFLLKGVASVKMTARTDSSSARALACRQGVGRVRHLQAGLLWVQQMVNQKEFDVKPVPGSLNPADLATKCHPRKRLGVLLRLSNFVDNGSALVGLEEYNDLLKSMPTNQGVRSVASFGANCNKAMVCAVLFSLMDQCGAVSVGSQDGSNTCGLNFGILLGFLVMVLFAFVSGTSTSGTSTSGTSTSGTSTSGTSGFGFVRALGQAVDVTFRWRFLWMIAWLSLVVPNAQGVGSEKQEDRGEHGDEEFDSFMCLFAFCFFVTCLNAVFAMYWIISRVWPACGKQRQGEEVRSACTSGSSTDRSAGSSGASAGSSGGRGLRPLDQDPNLPSYTDEFPNVHFIYLDRSEEMPWETVYITRTGGFYHQLECKWLKGRQVVEVFLPEALEKRLGRCRTCHGPFGGNGGDGRKQKQNDKKRK